jgi:hypothetical protein
LALYPTNITGVRGVSTVCRATGTNEVDHMPGGIDHMPSGIGSRPSGIELWMMGLIQSMYRIFEFFKELWFTFVCSHFLGLRNHNSLVREIY